MDNVSRIAEGLMKGHYSNNPHQSAEDLAILSGEFSYTLGQLDEILQKKPAIWSEMRKALKSDTSCERVWEGTADGMKETSLRLRSKSIEKMISALRSLLRIAENEARNTM